jgi:hypothetical protein
MSSNEMVAEQPKNQVAVIFDNITNGLKAFEARKEELTALAKEAADIKVTTYEDKANLKRATELRKKIKAERVKVEKEGKALRDPLNGVNKEISAKEKELTDIVAPGEKSLQEVEDWYDAEKERIAAEEQRREEQRIQTRITRLEEYGYSIDFNMLKAVSDEDFEKIVDSAKREFEKEEAAKAEKERQEQAQREQDERDRAELKALREKQEAADRILKEMEEEIARKEREMKEKEDAALRLEEKKKQDIIDARTKNRSRDLKALGMVYDSIIGGGSYNYENICVCVYPSIIKLEDDEWDTLLEDVSGSVKSAQKGAAERKAAEEERIRKEAAEKALADQKEREAEAKRQEEERLEAASDKEKIQRIIEQFQSIAYPEMKSAKAKKLVSEVKDLQAKIVAHIKAKM